MPTRTEVPADAITATIPTYRFGLKVGEMTVHVRANWDQALGGLAADIWAEDVNEDTYQLPHSLVADVLAEIKAHDERGYDEIEIASGKFERAA
jgi:hypothetical protein